MKASVELTTPPLPLLMSLLDCVVFIFIPQSIVHQEFRFFLWWGYRRLLQFIGISIFHLCISFWIGRFSCFSGVMGFVWLFRPDDLLLEKQLYMY